MEESSKKGLCRYNEESEGWDRFASYAKKVNEIDNYFLSIPCMEEQIYGGRTLNHIVNERHSHFLDFFRGAIVHFPIDS